MDLTTNYFDIFGLDHAFDIDLTLLAERYRNLQKEFHPDRFAGQSSTQQKLAVQYTAFINQAFNALQSPVARAQYLLEKQGLQSDHESTTVHDSDFLMSQMMLRESLSEIRDASQPFDELEKFTTLVNDQNQQLQRDFATQYQGQMFESAVGTVAKMQFYQKLLSEIEQLEEELDDL